jgi:myo-inositol 2-dehydrogenase/D-chiro-inositol 1-dehydrogenase
MLISGNSQPTAVERYGKDGVRRDPLLHFFIDRYAESYRRELDAFVQAVESGTAPPIGVDDGRRALSIADAGVRSAKSGMPVALA